MIKRHYIGRWPGVCVLILAMRKGTELLGTVVYALPPRETSKRYGGETWELARLWLDDAVPKNAETWLIAQSVRFIKRNCPGVRVLVSYADPSAGHSGTIYKAANWISDGRTDQERKSPRNDYADVETGKRYSRRSHVPPGVTIKKVARVSKHRFIYRLPAQARAAALPLPPPKRPAQMALPLIESERAIQRACTSCGTRKDIEDFPPRLGSPNGRHAWCRSCLIERIARRR